MHECWPAMEMDNERRQLTAKGGQQYHIHTIDGMLLLYDASTTFIVRNTMQLELFL